MNDQLFDVEEGEFLHVTFCNEISELLWTRMGGDLVDRLSLSKNSVRFNLSETKWADPFAFLSLITVTNGIIDQNSIAVSTVLPEPKSSDAERFLHFLDSQGFLTLLTRMGDVFIGKRKLGPLGIASLQEKLTNRGVSLVFSQPDCIKARLIQVSELTEESTIDLVEELVDEAYRTGVRDWLARSGRARGTVLHKIRVCLLEAIDNVREHAYHDNSGYVGVYARLRLGMPDNPRQRREWYKNYKSERKRSPVLYKSQAARAPGWVEVYVVDTGIGITHRHTKHSKAPLLSIAGKIFREGFSRVKDRLAANKTATTGLQHIGNTLSNVAPESGESTEGKLGDFVRLYCNGEWLGDHLPWPEKNLQPGHTNERNIVQALKRPASNCPMGTGYHFIIQPSVFNFAEQLKFYSSEFVRPNHDHLEAVRNSLKIADNEQVIINPNASAGFLDLFWADNNTRVNASRGARFRKLVEDVPGPTLIVRPDRATRKYDLHQQIQLLLELNNGEIRNFVLADVPGVLAVDFVSIIVSERFRSDRRTPFLLHVLSQDWAIASFEYSSKKQMFAPSRGESIKFLEDSDGAALVARVMRQRDSELFWERADHEDVRAFINEEIEWFDNAKTPNEVVISGYLDVGTALADPVCSRIARSALRRAISCSPNAQLYLSDETLRPVIGSDFGISISPIRTNASGACLISSVRMTGSTERTFKARLGIKNAEAIYLMAHGQTSSAATTIAALNWQPEQRPMRQPGRRYRRVKNTPFIFRGGEDAITLPRFSATTRQSLYEQSPNESYRFWQRQNILRFGHWVYGRHHDLITIDMAQALNRDVGGQGFILKWALRNIQGLIDDCTQSGKGIAIVYSRHATTDLLANTLQKEGLDPSLFFPFRVGRGESVSPLVSAPTSRERLWRHFKEKYEKGGVVLIIDDAIVTGETRSLLTEQVLGIWSLQSSPVNHHKLEIKDMTLLDRSARPTYPILAENETNENYRLWRWDVPALGNATSCLLCAALARAKELGRRLNIASLETRIQQWHEIWRPIEVPRAESDDGLAPVRLPEGGSTRFSKEQYDTTVDESAAPQFHIVEHKISTSRAAIACEIANSTTRIDYALTKTTETNNDDDFVLDAQTRVEVLASHCFLFWSRFTHHEKIQRLESIVDIIWEEREVSNYSAIACCCVFIDYEILPDLHLHILKKVEEQGLPNDDAILLTCLVYAHNPEFLGDNQSNRNWTFLKALLQPQNSLRSHLGRLFYVLGWDPGVVHRSLLSEHINEERITPAQISQIFMMLDVMISALENLDPQLIRRSKTFAPKLEAEAIKTASKTLTAALGVEAGRLNSINSGQADYQVSAKFFGSPKVSTSKIESWPELRSMLFSGESAFRKRCLRAFSAEVDNKDLFQEVIEPQKTSLLSDWPKIALSLKNAPIEWGDEPPVILMDPGGHKPIDKQYLYLDALIESLVRDVLSNVRHASKKITSPWTQSSYKAHMWIKAFIQDDCSSAEIQFANSTLEHEDSELNLKSSHYISHLKALGGGILNDVSDGVWYTTITVPTLRSLTLLQS